MRRFGIVLLLALSVHMLAFAQGASLPVSGTIPRMHMVWQQQHRGAAAVLTMALKHYGWEGTFDEVILALNPHADDVSARTEEIIAYAAQYDLRTIARTGGSIDLLKALVAAQFPVLVETAYVDGPDWMVHNRIVMGYDENALYIYDPILGAGANGEGRAMAYADFDAAWREANRSFIVIYPAGGELLLQTVLGSQWDEAYNIAATLEQAQAELEANSEDAFAWYNAGAMLLRSGQAAQAAQAFDRAREIGLPWRIFWYRHEPFEAYLQAERYMDTISLGEYVLGTTPGVEEVYYYMGQAYEGLGSTEMAAQQYTEALRRNTNYTAAEAALADITG